MSGIAQAQYLLPGKSLCANHELITDYSLLIMLLYTTAQTNADLNGILALQKANLAGSLSAEEISSQGFVTVVHSLADLRRLNETAPHIIAKDGSSVVAYLLAMTAAAKNDIPVLKPMFQLFDSVAFKGSPVSAYRYMVVGQVCVDKRYRGQGVLDQCYAAYKNIFSPEYAFAVTEIATRNTRSAAAHRRIGFTERHRYTAPDGEEWSVVAWDWR